MKHLFPILIVLLLISSNCIGVSYRVQKFSSVSFDGNTLYVGGSGPGNYTKIQDAIDNASDGDTVFVYSGVYYEHEIIVVKSINLIGENKQSTIIDGQDGDDDVVIVLSNGVVVNGFTVRDSGHYWGNAGIQVESINNIIEDIIVIETESGIFIKGVNGPNAGPNIISNCTLKENDKGIYVGGSDNCTVTNCYFINNWWPVYFQGDSEHYASYNIISNCTFDTGQEIRVARGNHNIIRNCDFSCARQCDGIIFEGRGNGNTVENCRIDSPFTGITIVGRGSDNSVLDCIITNSFRDGIYLGDDQHNLKVINCTFEGSEYGDGINFGGWAIDCVISNCRFLNNAHTGIDFHCLRWVDVSNCHFVGNKFGIGMYENNFFNRFSYNNFINEEVNILTRGAASRLNYMLNLFWKNYWNDWSGSGPYHIWGLLNWDLHPQKKPYNY